VEKIYVKSELQNEALRGTNTSIRGLLLKNQKSSRRNIWVLLDEHKKLWPLLISKTNKGDGGILTYQPTGNDYTYKFLLKNCLKKHGISVQFFK